LPASETVAQGLQRPRAIAGWHKELDAYRARVLDRVQKAHAVALEHHNLSKDRLSLQHLIEQPVGSHSLNRGIETRANPDLGSVPTIDLLGKITKVLDPDPNVTIIALDQEPRMQVYAVSPDHHRSIDASACARSRGWLQTTFA